MTASFVNVFNIVQAHKFTPRKWTKKNWLENNFPQRKEATCNAIHENLPFTNCIILGWSFSSLFRRPLHLLSHLSCFNSFEIFICEDSVQHYFFSLGFFFLNRKPHLFFLADLWRFTYFTGCAWLSTALWCNPKL